MPASRRVTPSGLVGIGTGGALPCPSRPGPGAGSGAAEDDDTPSKVAAPRRHPKPGDETGPLPEPVEEMRQAILAATHSGNIEDLRVPLDWNELKPEVAAPAGEDPIAYWKKTSATATGARSWRRSPNMLPDAGCASAVRQGPREQSSSTSGPISPRSSSTSSRPPRRSISFASSARGSQGDAREEEVDVVAADHRRRRHLAFVP